ncbi:MAG: family 16 glycosylhydrolase [Bacteroidota bacterium]
MMKNWSKLIPALAILLLLACGKDSEDDMSGGDDQISISINDVSLFEGNDVTDFEFIVRLSTASTEEVTVDYSTVASSATANDDYVPTSGTLTFPPSIVERSLSVRIITDDILEGDEEFRVLLSNAVNATIDRVQGTGVIRNDDTNSPVANDGYITPDAYAGKDLIWREEFDGTQIDASVWTHEIGGGGWGNNELQYYTDLAANSRVENGRLIIEAKQEPFIGRDYTSARMISMDKMEVMFGRIDIRAKLPKGQGIWPALWMLGGNFSSVGWPACGEIDIMELIGSEPSKVHGTAHWGPQGSSTSQSSSGDFLLTSGDFSDEFHVFSIIWELGSIKWYVNDQFYHEITTASVGNNSYPFNQRFFFILNIAVGGNWPGAPDGSTVFPQQMEVDYIRVFQDQ